MVFSFPRFKFQLAGMPRLAIRAQVQSESFLPTRSVSILQFKFQLCIRIRKLLPQQRLLKFMAQCSVDTVGAIIDRPARKFYEFALGFGKYETFPCAGAQ